MQQQPTSSIKALSILHLAMLGGQLFFSAAAYYVNRSGSMKIADLRENERFILLGVAALGLVMVSLALYIYKSKTAAIRDAAQAPKEKLIAYRTASLIRWAMLEAPVLVAIVAFMLTGNYNFLIIAGAIMLLFLSTKPSVAKAAAELGLREDEINN